MLGLGSTGWRRNNLAERASETYTAPRGPTNRAHICAMGQQPNMQRWEGRGRSRRSRWRSALSVTLQDVPHIPHTHHRPFRGPHNASFTPPSKKPSTQDPKRIPTCRNRHELNSQHNINMTTNTSLATHTRGLTMYTIQQRHGVRRRHGAVSIAP